LQVVTRDSAIAEGPRDVEILSVAAQMHGKLHLKGLLGYDLEGHSGSSNLSLFDMQYITSY